MKRWIAGLALAASLVLPLVVSAQPSPETRAKMDKIFGEAKTSAFAALTPDHRTKVQAIAGQVAAGSVGRRDAAKQIDDLLTANEKTAVMNVAQKVRTDMREAMGGSGGPPGGGPPGAGPGPGGAPPQGGPPGRSRQMSAGRFLLMLSRPPRREGGPPGR